MCMAVSVLALILFLVRLYYWIYNQLVSASETVNEAIATIDVQLQKRFNPVPGLVKITKA